MGLPSSAAIRDDAQRPTLGLRNRPYLDETFFHLTNGFYSHFLTHALFRNRAHVDSSTDKCWLTLLQSIIYCAAPQASSSKLLLIADNPRTSYHYGSRFVNTPFGTLSREHYSHDWCEAQ
jgi:hypothetical protein